MALLALGLIAAGKKEPEVMVRFFTEANAKDTGSFSVPVMFQNPPRRGYISKIPNLSERDVRGIYLFPGNDGTIGCAFYLDEHGTVMLDTLSVEKRGTSLLAIVNGRQVIDMLIDRRVSDGIVTIPRGLTPEEGNLLKKAFRSVTEPAGGR